MLTQWLSLLFVTSVLLTSTSCRQLTMKTQQPHILFDDAGIMPPRANPNRLPVVLWHGMGDTCCSRDSIGGLKSKLETYLGVYVKSIGFGDEAQDRWSGIFGNVNDQVSTACAELRHDPDLALGYNAIGFSQGGQFLRALVERCQHTGPKAHNLITLGSQHQGVTNIPHCNALPSNSSWDYCVWMRSLLSVGVFLPWVRDHVVQAQYFKDPRQLDEYLQLNPFLPDVNNEKADKSPIYKENLASLNKFVMFRFGADETVVPADSAWWSILSADYSRVIPLREQPLYQEDWLGLRAMDAAGKLEFPDIPGALHMHFSLAWFYREVVDKYLA